MFPSIGMTSPLGSPDESNMHNMWDDSMATTDDTIKYCWLDWHSPIYTIMLSKLVQSPSLYAIRPIIHLSFCLRLVGWFVALYSCVPVADRGGTSWIDRSVHSINGGFACKMKMEREREENEINFVLLTGVCRVQQHRYSVQFHINYKCKTLLVYVNINPSTEKQH